MSAPVPHVAAMSPYALASLAAPAGKRFVSLSQNESLRPPSPLAVEAAARALAAGQLYPDPDWRALRGAISALHDIPEASIICGSGSMQLIESLTRAYCDENGAVLAPAHAYPFFRTAALLNRARFDTAPEQDGCVWVDALLDSVRAETRIVFVANPGNPTGTRISRAELVRLRDGLPASVLLVIDEAYGEFADQLEAPIFDLATRGDTVILRTFSKAYGLAGLRVGWGLFPDPVAREMRKVMPPNNISAAAQDAATAALADQAYMRETCALTAGLRDRFAARLRSSGFEVADSFTNFVLIRFDTAEAAESAARALQTEGVILRGQAGAGLPACLRVTVGTAEDLDLAAGLLEQWNRGDRE